jgi:hypothetical protein
MQSGVNNKQKLKLAILLSCTICVLITAQSQPVTGVNAERLFLKIIFNARRYHHMIALTPHANKVMNQKIAAEILLFMIPCSCKLANLSISL